MVKLDENGDGKVTRKEFIGHSGLPEAVFDEFDADGSGDLVIPEYLRIWDAGREGSRRVYSGSLHRTAK